MFRHVMFHFLLDELNWMNFHYTWFVYFHNLLSFAQFVYHRIMWYFYTINKILCKWLWKTKAKTKKTYMVKKCHWVAGKFTIVLTWSLQLSIISQKWENSTCSYVKSHKICYTKTWSKENTDVQRRYGLTHPKNN